MARKLNVTLYGYPEFNFPCKHEDANRDMYLEEETHRYVDRKTGDVFESVTTFLARKGLTTVPPDNERVKSAGARGTAIHKKINEVFAAKRDNFGTAMAHNRDLNDNEERADPYAPVAVTGEYHEEVSAFFNAFAADTQEDQFIVARSEKILWKWGLAGTADLIYTDNLGRQVMLDVKTGKKPNLDACCYQLLFYSYLYHWLYHDNIDRLVMAHITHDAKCEFIDFRINPKRDHAAYKLVDKYFNEIARDRGNMFLKVSE